MKILDWHQSECGTKINIKTLCGNIWRCSGQAWLWHTYSWLLDIMSPNNLSPVDANPHGKTCGLCAWWACHLELNSSWRIVLAWLSFSIQFYSPNQSPVFVILVSTDLFSLSIHKVQPIRLTGGLFEGEGIVSWFFVGGKGVGEVGNIFWWELGYFFVMEHFGWKTCCFW